MLPLNAQSIIQREKLRNNKKIGLEKTSIKMSNENPNLFSEINGKSNETSNEKLDYDKLQDYFETSLSITKTFERRHNRIFGVFTIYETKEVVPDLVWIDFVIACH